MIKQKYSAYVSGQMTGIPKKNILLFNAVSASLRSMGWAVLNPAELGQNKNWQWADYILRDLQCMFGFRPTAIVLLPNWFKSRGSTYETIIGLNVLNTKFFAWDSKKGLTEMHKDKVRKMINYKLLVFNKRKKK